ncbi:MAG: hypothetical protein WC527_04940 [Candidatus Margulisiibacteriota bacterium]
MIDRNDFWLERYKTTIKVTENCRSREFSMLNFTIAIFGTSIWFLYQIKSDLFRFLGSFCLCIVISSIGIYIAKLNAVEQIHHFIEKNIYMRTQLTEYDGIQYQHWKGLNKWVLMLIFVSINIVLLSISGMFLWRLNILNISGKLCCLIMYAFVVILCLFIYSYFFHKVAFLPKSIEDEIIKNRDAIIE